MISTASTVFKRIALIIGVPVNLIIALLLVVAAYSGGVNPDKLAMAQVVNMTFPIWLVCSIVILIVDLIFVRRLAWFPAVALVVSGPTLLMNAPLRIYVPAPTSAEKKTEFKVLTYNVMSFNDYRNDNPEWGNRTISYIISVDADIVCLQEAAPLRGRDAVCNAAQRDSLKAMYPYYVDIQRHVGELIMSKYPVTLIENNDCGDGIGKFTLYSVDIDGREVTVVNCHLESIGLTSDDKAVYRELTDKEFKPTRAELSYARHDLIPKLTKAFRNRASQVRRIRALLADRGPNVLLMGDFNDVPGSYAYRMLLDAGLKDVYRQCAFFPTITYYDSRFYFHIDHIMYRGDMRPVSWHRGNVDSSDHYPVWATFVWTDNKTD